MAESALKFEVHSDPEMREFAFRVRGIAAQIDDFTPLLHGLGDLFKAAEQKQFATEGGSSGGWAPLTAAYAAWKEQHFPGRPIGVLRGHLRSAMTGGAGYSQHVTKNAASYGMEGGPALDYGKYFDARRKVIAFGTGESAKWRRMAEDWAAQAALASGWGKS